MGTITSSTRDHDSLLGETAGLLTLRVRSREHQGRVLRIRSPKCSIGSDANCTLRLRAPGVRPLHCLVLRGTRGTYVRRWSPDTCLNGATFTDSPLKTGDRLHIGAIELEVLDDPTCRNPAPTTTVADHDGLPDEIDRPGPHAAKPVHAAGDVPEGLPPKVDVPRESWRQQQAALAELQRQYDQLRQTLETEQSEYEQYIEQLNVELDEARKQADKTADAMTGQLQSQLSEHQTELAAVRDQYEQLQQTGAAEQDQLRQRLEQLSSELEQTRHQLEQREQDWQQQTQHWLRQQEEWQSVEQQLRQQREEDPTERDSNGAQASESNATVEALESKFQQLEAQLTEYREQMQHAECRRDQLIAEVTRWKETAESRREELDDTREQHQRARDEWQTEHQAFKHALAERGAQLKQLEAQHNELMEEAEQLIHSLQQEGKQLLAQLLDAKQTIRDHSERIEQLQASLASLQRLPEATDAPGRSAPTNPLREDHPALSQTIVMARFGGVDSSAKTRIPTRTEPIVYDTPRDFVEHAQPLQQFAADPLAETTEPAQEHGSAENPATSKTLDGVAHRPEMTVALGAEFQPRQPELSVPEAGPVSSNAPSEPVEHTQPLQQFAADPLAETAERVQEHESADNPATPEIPDGVAHRPEMTVALGAEFQPEQLEVPEADAAPSDTAQPPDHDHKSSQLKDDQQNDQQVQQYMEGLLKRIGQEPSGGDVEETWHATQENLSSSEELSAAPKEDHSSDESDRGEGSETHSMAPEVAADLLAMRELANQTAHQAIHHSDRRRLAASVVGEMTVASLMVAGGILVLCMKPALFSGYWVGGIMGVAFGVLAGLRGFGTIRSFMRLKRAATAGQSRGTAC